MAGAEPLFDPEFLRRLRTLFFKLRRRRALRRKGAQSTPALGFTREFKDHRAYTFSDDFRAIDWRLYARLERLFVRLFEEVQEFHVHLLLDRSASMAEPHPEKRVTALRLALALAYLGLMNQHRVSLYAFGADLTTETPPLKGPGHVHRLIQRLEALPFRGETDLGALARFRPRRDRRGIVFVLSDLLGPDPARTPEALGACLAWPAETHVVHLLHPRERRPVLEGELKLTEVETGEQRRIFLTRRDLERYAAAFDAFCEGVARACLTRQVDYLAWSTEVPFERGFLDLLSRGSALARG